MVAGVSIKAPASRPVQALERTSELAALGAALEQVGGGTGTTVLVRGPAGIGKSTLLAACRAMAGRRKGMAAMTHAGLPHESQHTYAGVVGLLHAAVRQRLLAPGRDPFTGAAHLALPLFETGRVGAHGEFPLLHGLHWLCAELSEENPLVLLADDVQWYDQPSLRALSYLAERVSDLPLLLVLAERSGEDPSSTALQELGERASTVLEPQPLSPQAVSRLAHDSTEEGLAPSAAVVEEVVRRSGGNPFLANELLRLHAGDPQAVLATATPDSIVSTTEQRLRATSDVAREVAEAVAVLGATARVHDIATTLGRERDDIGAAIDDLVERDLFVVDDTVGFRHPLIRDAVLSGLPTVRLHELTVRAAHAVHDSHPARAAALLVDSAPLAPLREDWVVPALLAAASAARGRAGAAEAARYLERALAEPLDGPAELQVRHALGSVLDESGDPAALDQLAAADRLCAELGSEHAPGVALSHADALFHFAQLLESAAVCREAIAGLPAPADSEILLALEAAALNAEALIGVNRARPAALERDVAAADTPGQRAVLTHVAWDAAARGSRPPDQVADLAIGAIADGLLTEEVGAASPTFVYAGTALAWAGDYEAARHHAETGIQRAAERGSLVGVAYATSLRAGVAIYQGNITQAETDVRRVLDELADADPMCFAVTLGWAMEVAIEQEAPQPMADTLAAVGLDAAVPDIGTLDTMLLSRARLRAELGDRDLALADLAEVARRSERSSYLSAACSPWRSMSAHVLMQTGATERALQLAEDEVALAREFAVPRALGQALRARAATRDEPDAAVVDLREAIDVLTDSGANLQLAEALVELGSEPAAGDVAARRALLRDGMSSAHACGSGRVVTRAMDALRSTGARPRRPSHRGADALTPQERRITRLAAEGRGNREIAETMFLTRRTVELHLSNAYRKLGIEGRNELAAALDSPPGHDTVSDRSARR